MSRPAIRSKCRRLAVPTRHRIGGGGERRRGPNAMIIGPSQPTPVRLTRNTSDNPPTRRIAADDRRQEEHHRQCREYRQPQQAEALADEATGQDLLHLPRARVLFCPAVLSLPSTSPCT